ncbi:c-type cytochrome [Stieleria sp. TO1_6]|uniref:PVC-type heme-binding CxxCH protein n=1 Tax=Stieleria tagensis TaxID=2956795 RepID=UPI00209BA2F8|nr:PVC-type heme-binding CxxCH protein [Stieleria tagensis]MCO8124163.1 c-type cytochrome [Stieleria tagensis]
MNVRYSIPPTAVRFVAGLVFATIPWASATALGDDFPVVFNNESTSDAQPMPAEQAAATMQLPDGFSATVFASEPEVQNPIAMAWDDRQRMWVAENYTYSDRTQHFDLSLRDRVIILDDSDGDGKADSRKVFTDQVQMLTSVELGRGGVWLMCPPQLLFIPDADQDDVPDGPPQVVLDGFTVADSNYHNFANGLRWGPDGWLYGRCGHSCPGNLGVPGTPDTQRIPISGGIWRYHPDRQTVEVLCHGTVNPWGHDWDANGELFFINTVIGHLWHCISGAHFKESFGDSANPLVYDRIDMIADHYHYDRTGTWQASRDGAANSLGGGHAHIGMMIYQSDRWPQNYRNKLFTLNMHGLRANVERIRRQGAGYVASHEPDFLIAEDPFFRGIEINVGPDGDVYVLDWSDTGECHDHTGVHRTSGRVYKISFDAGQPSTRPFSKPACLSGESGLAQLWRDYQSGATTPEQLRSRLQDPDEHVRVWAIRLLTDHWPIDTLHGPLPDATYPDDPQTRQALINIARNDSSGLVLMGLASTLQRLPLQYRAELATELVRRQEFAHDRDLPALVWYGLMPLVGHDPAALVAVGKQCRLPSTLKSITRGVASQVESHPGTLDDLLAAAIEMPPALQASVLAGMSDAFRGWLKVSMPNTWPQFSQTVAALDRPDTTRQLNLLFGDGRAVEELRELALSSKEGLQTRQSALRTLIDARPDDLRQICEKLLGQRGLNATAAQGLALFDDPAIGQKLAKTYRRFQSDDRPGVIEILVSRPSFAAGLLDQMGADRDAIPRDDITAFHARQILSLGDDGLRDKLGQVWGTLRDSPTDRRDAIKTTKDRLTPELLAEADLSAGRALFKKTCAQCHRLFGEGEKIGPDLTGAQRASLDYLLENILDPSAVVGKDYRMTIVLTDDGRVLNGLVVSKNDKTMVIQTQSRQETLPLESIDQINETTLSPMPDGLLTTLSPEQIRDLIAYLMSPTQVPLN